MLRRGAGLCQELDDPPQRGRDLGCEIRRIFALLVAAGLARQHHPSAGALDLHTMGKTARFRPFGRLQDAHDGFLQKRSRTRRKTRRSP